MKWAHIIYCYDIVEKLLDQPLPLHSLRHLVPFCREYAHKYAQYIRTREELLRETDGEEQFARFLDTDVIFKEKLKLRVLPGLQLSVNDLITLHPLVE